MNIRLELYELKNIIMEMSEIGAANYAKTITPQTDTFSERQAFKMFGETNVRRWISEGSIDYKRIGASKNSRKIYSYSQLLAILTNRKNDLEKNVLVKLNYVITA